MRTSFSRAFTLASMLIIGTASPARAGSIGPLGSLTSDGSQGDIASMMSGNAGNNWVLNTDTSVLAYLANNGSPFLAPSATLVSSLVTQANGPSVRVFSFSTFTINSGFTLNLVGSLPVAIVASGDMTINGTLSAGAYYLNNQGSHQAGAGGGASESSAGGGGGSGGAFASGAGGGAGGGGGNVSRGLDGQSRVVDVNCGFDHTACGTPSGGEGGVGGRANDQLLGALNGGGGGGNGGSWVGPFQQSGTGLSGGDGGGALFLSTPGNFYIGLTGVVSADGGSTPGCCRNSGGGGGGGGAGGDLWFSVANTFTNNGYVSAAGGGGTVGAGAGSGGFVFIDPLAIVNNGVINVADGNGSSANGGRVYLVADEISGSGQITGDIAPEPGTFALLLIPAAGMILRRRASRLAKTLP